MRWIGLCGRMASGKDHTFEELKKLNSNLARVSFAWELRHEINDAYGIPWYTLTKKPLRDEIRSLLQWYGTDYRREQDPDYWARKAESRARALARGGLVPVFTDVRFQNEADMIRNNGGIIVKVWATDEERAERGANLDNDGHISELSTSLIQEDFFLWSRDDTLYAGSLDDLMNRATERIHPSEDDEPPIHTYQVEQEAVEIEYDE